MRKIILTIILIISGNILFAQNNNDATYRRPLNSININLLGDASFMSVNYERLFLISPAFILSSKLGLGCYISFCIIGSCGAETYPTIPHHITANFGEGRHFIEFGLGGTGIFGDISQNYLLYPIIGYRLQPLNSKQVYFRIYMQKPFPIGKTEDMFFSKIGISLGKSF